MHQRIPTTFGLMLLAGCVTINVYFPEAATQRAADRIIEDVWDQGAPAEDPDAVKPTAPEHQGARLLPGMALAVLNFVIPVAHAQAPQIDISSPAVQDIVAAMEARYETLQPYYASGAIGLTSDALIAIRANAAVPLSQRNRLRQLVAGANADRQALYHELALANGHPEWEDKIRAIFAERWIANAQAGWYYQTDGGQWVKKQP